MPIKIDNSSIEFCYEINDIMIYIKYHSTEIGPTISLSLNKENWFDFPATLFSEVTDFLRNKYSLLGGPVKKSANAILPLAKKVEIEEDEEDEENIEEDDSPVEIADIEPVQSLFQLARGTNIIPKQASVKNASETKPIKKASNENKGVVIINDGENVDASQFGRSVKRSDKENINHLSDEEILSRQKMSMPVNDSKVILRTG